MALTITTNLSSLIAQSNLNAATTMLNSSIERMTTGYKINHAKDNAAGYSIATNWETKLSSLDIAAQNTAMGIDMLKTAEENYDLITNHIQRIRDLTEQAANGTYGTTSIAAIKAEIESRLAEIDRISQSAEYNGISLMAGGGAVTMQVGVASDANSQITTPASVFLSSKSVDIIKKADNSAFANNAAIATSCTTAATAASSLALLDTALSTISTRSTDLGTAQNRLESAAESIEVQIQNLTSSLSTIKDADVAQESSRYIRSQILQQASATLLSTANQLPSIALNLL